MPKNIKDIDMINCHPVILLNLCQKNDIVCNSHPLILLNLCQKNDIVCNILKNYVENRDTILDSFGDDKKSVKKCF